VRGYRWQNGKVQTESSIIEMGSRAKAIQNNSLQRQIVRARQLRSRRMMKRMKNLAVAALLLPLLCSHNEIISPSRLLHLARQASKQASK